MTLYDFERGMKKLMSFFARKQLDTEQLQSWYDKFKRCDTNAFFSGVDEITESNRFFPTPAELRAAVGKYEKLQGVDFVLDPDDGLSVPEVFGVQASINVRRILTGEITYHQGVENLAHLREKHLTDDLKSPWWMTGDKQTDRKTAARLHRERVTACLNAGRLRRMRDAGAEEQVDQGGSWMEAQEAGR